MHVIHLRLIAIVVGCAVTLGAFGACAAFSAEPDAPEPGPETGPVNAPAEAGDAGRDPASCVGLPVSCGNLAAQPCCASAVVPGGTFDRSSDAGTPAKVSSFKLDIYEVTLGRFRAFVNAAQGTQASPPAPGDGAHPKIPSSGWDASYRASLTLSTSALQAALKCSALGVWTDAAGMNERRAMNCVTWFEALAFCAWDGGRLPTEAEWNYAAAGGSEQRDYPWGAGIDEMKASYCAEAGCPFSTLSVGAKSPQGDGKWGQTDLAGGVSEWALDGYVEPYAPGKCDDCAQLGVTSERVLRGGASGNQAQALRTWMRMNSAPATRYASVGFRCARAVD